MKHINFSNFFKKLAIGIASCFCLLGATACSGTEKYSYDVAVVACSYDSSENKTEVNYKAELTNLSVIGLDTKSVSITFDLYKGYVPVGTSEEYNYDVSIKDTKSTVLLETIVVDGEVDNIKVNTISYSYDTVWNSYKAWCILSIAAFAVTLTILVIALVKSKFDWKEALESIWLFITSIAGACTLTLIITEIVGLGFEALFTHRLLAVAIALGGIAGAFLIFALIVLAAKIVDKIKTNKTMKELTNKEK